MCDKTKLKPFDLERALAGDPVKHFTQHVVVYGKAKFNSKYLIVEDSCHVYYAHPDELCMAPKKKTVYVNFYKQGTAFFYESKSVAEEVASNNALAVAVPVEIEV